MFFFLHLWRRAPLGCRWNSLEKLHYNPSAKPVTKNMLWQEDLIEGHTFDKGKGQSKGRPAEDNLRWTNQKTHFVVVVKFVLGSLRRYFYSPIGGHYIKYFQYLDSDSQKYVREGDN